MFAFGALQQFVFLVLAVVVFAAQVVSLIDAARRPARGYTAEGKLTKTIWLLILGVAAVFGPGTNIPEAASRVLKLLEQ